MALDKAQADYEFIAYSLGLTAIAAGIVLYFTSGGTVPQLSLNPPTFTPLPPGVTPTPLPPGTTPLPFGTTPTSLPPGVTPTPPPWATPTPLPPGTTPTPSPSISPTASPTASPTTTPTPTPIPGDSPPSVSLIDPLDNLVSFSTSVYFYCTASDDYEVTSISLFTNKTGEWESYYSVESNVLEYTDVFTAGYFEWSCYAADNASKGGWGERRHFEVID